MSDIDWNDLDGQEPDDPWEDPEPRREKPADVAMTPAGDPGTTSLRARVLAHPDLARRLCDPPLRYSRPECWTGYVPSEQWQGRHNDSTRRLQLIGIVAELEGREQAAVAATTNDEEEPS